MSRIGLLVVVGLVVLAACGGRQPSGTTPSSGPTGITWPTKLEIASTPESHHAAALLVLDTSGAESAMTSMIDISLDAQLKQNPSLMQFKSVMREFLVKYLSYQAVREELAKAYAERFDELQLRQIAAFYQTPTGKLAVSKIPELTQLGGQIGLRRVEEHKAELIEMLQKAAQQSDPH